MWIVYLKQSKTLPLAVLQRCAGFIGWMGLAREKALGFRFCRFVARFGENVVQFVVERSEHKKKRPKNRTLCGGPCPFGAWLFGN